jgi:hypothetical protein
MLHCNNRSIPMTVKDNVNAINELTDKGMARMNALGELNLKAAEKVVARQMDAFNLFMEQGVRLMTLATEAKGYSDFYKGQIDMAKEMTQRMMAESKTNMQVAGELRDEYRGWLDAAMAEARDSKDVVRNAVTA